MTPEEHREVFRTGWNAAISAALTQVPGGDTCRPADVADAIRELFDLSPKPEFSVMTITGRQE